MDPARLLEQFLGGQQRSSRTDSDTSTGAGSGGLSGLAGGLAAGGLLGMLLSSKRARKTTGKLVGGAVGYGGAAVLGALGLRAYQNWQASRDAASTTSVVEEQRFIPGNAPAADGRPFELALVMAMVAAANADGHIGPDEQRSIFERTAELPLDAEDKAFVFDTLASPPTLADIASLAGSREQAVEIYLASRLAIDPDEAAEQAYLEALARRLELPPELVQALESEAATAGDA